MAEVSERALADVQAVWAAVAVSADEQALNEGGIALLRVWTADRMRNLSFAVFEPGDGQMLPSFAIAIDHAAAQIGEGRVPE